MIPCKVSLVVNPKCSPPPLQHSLTKSIGRGHLLVKRHSRSLSQKYKIPNAKKRRPTAQRMCPPINKGPASSPAPSRAPPPPPPRAAPSSPRCADLPRALPPRPALLFSFERRLAADVLRSLNTGSSSCRGNSGASCLLRTMASSSWSSPHQGMHGKTRPLRQRKKERKEKAAIVQQPRTGREAALFWLAFSTASAPSFRASGQEGLAGLVRALRASCRAGLGSCHARRAGGTAAAAAPPREGS